MLLATALLRSLSGIATRRREIRVNAHATKYAYEFAVSTGKTKQRLVIHIINGLNGAVRRTEAVDQLQTDWEPFQEIPALKGKKMKP